MEWSVIIVLIPQAAFGGLIGLVTLDALFLSELFLLRMEVLLSKLTRSALQIGLSGNAGLSSVSTKLTRIIHQRDKSGLADVA